MPSTLDVIKARLERADEHLAALREQQVALIAGEGFCRTELQVDRHKRNGIRRMVARITHVEEFPPSYTIAIGDIAHSLRAALDNLAFAVVKPAAEKERLVYFPICETSTKFKGVAPRMLPGASKRVSAAFERLQPYHRRKMPNAEYLLHLNALNNWDKHRAIAVCALNGIVARVHVAMDARFQIVRHKLHPIKRLKAGAVLATFYAKALPDTPVGTQGDVNINPQFMIVAAFDERMTPPVGGSNALLVLDMCRQYIEGTVIPELEPYL
jgi:hypothetical protein